ncbi:MAG: endonuclease/exonuclease/phosphatase family protein, partial [Flavobacteriaceae bacterium]|nr:endonuclease/exonuclease/phosphatase family protein [Flavobacteriaceae bacterium]
KWDPDIVLTMESDFEWENALNQLSEDYPYSVKAANNHYYGMHLYSRIELLNTEVKYLVEDRVPSIYFDLEFLERPLSFCCLHPAPPSPTENKTSEERDAELMKAGKYIRSLDKSAVICGDMNDVVWSRPTRLFKKLTGMIDPRVGRGFFPTYHARYPFMRFPLDHLFHTQDLKVGKMKRTPYFGSDHFGMYYEIHRKKKIEVPENPIIEKEEIDEINELIIQVEA